MEQGTPGSSSEQQRTLGSARERQRAPRNASERPITLILPFQTHLGIENALYLLKKTPDQNNYPWFARPNTPRSKKAFFLLKKTPDQIKYPCFATPTTKLQDAGFHTWRQNVTSNPTVQFSPVQSSCSIRPWSREHQGELGATESNGERQEAPKSPKERQRAANYPFLTTPKNRPPTKKSMQLPLFCNTKHTSESKNTRSNWLPLSCHTKHTSEPKMPHFYLKKHPIKLITLVLPHQTHLGAKNALFLPKKTPAIINYPCFATPNAPRNQKCLIFT